MILVSQDSSTDLKKNARLFIVILIEIIIVEPLASYYQTNVQNQRMVLLIILGDFELKISQNYSRNPYKILLIILAGFKLIS